MHYVPRRTVFCPHIYSILVRILQKGRVTLVLIPMVHKNTNE